VDNPTTLRWRAVTHAGVEMTTRAGVRNDIIAELYRLFYTSTYLHKINVISTRALV